MLKTTSLSIILSLIISFFIGVFIPVDISFSPPYLEPQKVSAADGESWYSTGGTWNYRKKITINNNQVVDVTTPSTTYANFPILISTTGLSNIKANGADIRFTMSNGITEIPREIENYSSGNLEAWVKLTLTKDDGDAIDDNDVIYMYYGNNVAEEPAVDSDYGRNNVWSDAGAVGIWHMAEGTGDYIYDSSGNSNTGTITGANWVTDGLDFNGTSDNINIPVDTQSGTYSISFLVYPRGSDFEYLMDIRTGGGVGYIYYNSGTTLYSTSGAKYVNGALSSALTLNEWNYITLSGINFNIPSNIILNSRYSSIDFADIISANTKIYNRVLSAEEIETQFNNQSDVESFLILGTEEAETIQTCAQVEGVCQANQCFTYTNCSSIMGTCDTGYYCCLGACTISDPDTTFPANITNLLISSCASNSCVLTWTAPGDDDNTGTATSYDIRYFTSNITDANWNSAIQVTGESSPQTAGLTETHIATGLTPEIIYYFAIKTADEVSNNSELSNIANATTGETEVINTLTYPIIDTGDDARFTIGSGYSNNASTEYIDYLERDLYMKFKVDIPKGATISSATIKLVPYGESNTNDSDIKINLIDSDDCPMFTGADRYTNTDTYVDYSIDGTIWHNKINNTESPYEITGFQSLVQAYVNRSGYDYHQYMGIHFEAIEPFDYKLLYSSGWDGPYDTDYDPVLTITFFGGDTVLSEVYMAEPYVRIKQKLFCQLVNTKEGDKLVVTVDGVEQVNKTLSSYTKGEEVVTVDYTGFTAGDHSLVVQVKNSAGVNYPSSFTKNWTTLHNGIPKVGINENNAICLEGTPFFPITPYLFSLANFEDPPQSCIAGSINALNGVGFYNTHDVESWKNYLARSATKNWYVVGPLRWEGKADQNNLDNSDNNKIVDYINQTKNSSHLLAWAWADEPNPKFATTLKEWTDLCHQNDTNHPVLLNIVGYGATRGGPAETGLQTWTYDNSAMFGERTNVIDILQMDYYTYEYATADYQTTLEEYVAVLEKFNYWNHNIIPLSVFLESQDVHDNYRSNGTADGVAVYLNVSDFSGNFQSGEIVNTTSGGSGTIPIAYDNITINSFVRPDSGTIIVENKTGTFNPNDILTGQTSGATARYLSVNSNLPRGYVLNKEWTPGVSPAELKNMIWLSIIYGVKMISYFDFFCTVPAENCNVTKEAKNWITELTQPILSGDPTTTTTCSETGAGRIDHMTKDYNGTTYIFAARVKKETGDNPGNETATFTVSGLTAGTNIAVYGEGRSITTGSGTFQDTFADHDVHIYEVGGVTPPDITPPVASVSINLNNKITNSQTTTLSTPASDLSGVTEMKISNTNDFSTAVTCAYTTVKEWILTAGDGLKTVYAWFKDSVGNWTDEFNPKIDTIRLDTAVPIISNILTSNITYNSVTINFNTNENSRSYIEYGPTASYGLQTEVNIGFLKNYELLISDLSDNITYNYRIVSIDYANNSSQSINQTFTTEESSIPDTTPPSDITSLTATNITQTSASLNWTSPGDDNNAGIASLYDLRYSTSNITESNFNSTTQLSGEPNPTTAGTNQSMIAVGLSPNTTYYFAIKTTDNASNVSNLSNIISITTLSESTPPPTPPSDGGGDGGDTGGGGSYSDTTPPSIPDNFTATPAESQITLSWNNPTSSDFVRVKILRKEESAPLTHNDETAEVIYEGTNEEYTDINLDNNTTYHYAIFAYDQKPNYSQILSISSQPIAGKTTIEIPNEEPTYPNGTLLKTIESFKVYIIIDNKKKWIPTPEVFETLGYQWTNITIITKTNLNKIPNYEDNLIRAINDYKVYLIVNGISRHLPNPEIFLDYGFSWDDVIDVPQATINQYQRAYLIRESRQGKIYYLRNDGIKKHIPNAEVFASYNNNWDDIQVISKREMESYVESYLIQLSGDNKIYLIESGVKRYIASAEIFNRNGFEWENVVGVNETEFNLYRIGSEVR